MGQRKVQAQGKKELGLMDEAIAPFARPDTQSSIPDTRKAVGRVVAATLREFSVECFQRDMAPPLGALVAITEDRPAIYGIVAAIVTEGVDPSRPVAPHGSAEEDLETVLNRNPHLPVLLRTTFTAVIVGHDADSVFRSYLPDAPPRLISRVFAGQAAEQHRLAANLDFLEPLLNSGSLGDEVVAACIRRLAAARSDRYAFLLGAGRALVPLLINEPERLTAIVRRIRPGEYS